MGRRCSGHESDMVRRSFGRGAWSGRCGNVGWLCVCFGRLSTLEMVGEAAVWEVVLLCKSVVKKRHNIALSLYL